ncbi:MAG: P-loop NTPase [Haloarculaceae archaeon]
MEAPLDDRVEAALRRVRDPEADISVFEAGFVEDIQVTDEGRVTLEADLREGDARTADEVVNAMLAAVDDVEAVEGVTVERVTASTGEDGGGVGGFDAIVAVASAKGGVGKSTVATHLACALSSDAQVGLFDADVYGPNAPELLDVSGPVHSSEEGHPLPIRTAGLEVMSVGLMESGAPLAWRGAMAHDAVSELFDDTAWTNDDTLVVDLPPGTGDVVLTTLQEVPVDGVVVVTTPFHASVSDTRRTVELFRDNGIPVLGAVVNMREVVCETCGDPTELFGEGALDELAAETLVELPFSKELQGTPKPGAVPDAVTELAGAVRSAMETVGEVEVASGAVDLRGVHPEERRELVERQWVSLESGEEFALVSDRDPEPVRTFLAEVSGVLPGDIRPFEVTRETPDAWMLRAVKP